MEWETKVELAKALNNGNNKDACKIILNNEMDMQAWDMFICGMDLREYNDYKCLYDKLMVVKEEFIKHAGIAETLRFSALISKIEIID